MPFLNGKRLAALLLCLCLLMGSLPALAAPGETLQNSKWINTDLAGSIDENTPLRLEDDFHGFVNRQRNLDEEEDTFSKVQDLVQERLDAIFDGEFTPDPANAEAIGLGGETLEHMVEQLGIYRELVQLENREAQGVEPARPFIEAVENIKTLADLDAYLLNADHQNVSATCLMSTSVIPDPVDKSHYILMLTPESEFVLGGPTDYRGLTGDLNSRVYTAKELVHYLLERLGYTPEQAEDILTRCFRFESRLTQRIIDPQERFGPDYQEKAKAYTLEEADALAGAYPLKELLASRGLDRLETVSIREDGYFRLLGDLYREEYLEEIKALFIVRSCADLLDLMDLEALVLTDNLMARMGGEEETPITEENRGELTEEKNDILMSKYFHQQLPQFTDQIYVAQHCTPQMKADIMQLCEETRSGMAALLDSQTWMSPEARTAAKEKLDAIYFNVLYPDTFIDFTDLSFTPLAEGGTLPQAWAALKAKKVRVYDHLAGTEDPLRTWNYEAGNVLTDTNAFYHPSWNSVTILPGLACGDMYDPSFTQEKLMARLGVVIGHEITHGFDAHGSSYNKMGLRQPWWSNQDEEAFRSRTHRLENYYSALMPLNGLLTYHGAQVSSEAIADMGGVKIMLKNAGEDFDYDAFFRHYANLWHTSTTRESEQNAFLNDSHPLPFLRTNVTLQQIPEFYETYQIQPGDGMYLAEENRISVW